MVIKGPPIGNETVPLVGDPPLDTQVPIFCQEAMHLQCIGLWHDCTLHHTDAQAPHSFHGFSAKSGMIVFWEVLLGRILDR